MKAVLEKVLAAIELVLAAQKVEIEELRAIRRQIEVATTKIPSAEVTCEGILVKRSGGPKPEVSCAECREIYVHGGESPPCDNCVRREGSSSS